MPPLGRRTEKGDQGGGKGCFPVVRVMASAALGQGDLVPLCLQHVPHMAARVKHRNQVAVEGSTTLQAANRQVEPDWSGGPRARGDRTREALPTIVAPWISPVGCGMADAAPKGPRLRQDIADVQPGTVSLMPPGLADQLTRQELADLLAFLKDTRSGAH